MNSNICILCKSTAVRKIADFSRDIAETSCEFCGKYRTTDEFDRYTVFDLNDLHLIQGSIKELNLDNNIPLLSHTNIQDGLIIEELLQLIKGKDRLA